ncbi:MAG: hypothetical protein RLZZ565_98 [Planctomycetota bacterium]
MSGRPIDAVLPRLRKVKPNGDRSWLACCPAHDDRNPSLSVSVGDDGRVLFNCFAGCSSDDVRSALGLEWRDLHAELIEDVRRGTRAPRAAPSAPQSDEVATKAAADADPEPPTPTGHAYGSLDEVLDAYGRSLGEPNATWHYRDAAGETIGAVYRWNTPTGKTIRPAFRFADGWRMTYPPVRPLYRLDTLATEDRVFVVEGEKAADRLASLGYPVTTSPGGSKAADRAAWQALVAREVVILPDADNAGDEYADKVETILSQDPSRTVAVLRLDGLRYGSGDDVVEWIDNVHEGDEDAAARALEAAAAEALYAATYRNRPFLSAAEILADPAWSRPPDVLRTGVQWFDDVQPFDGIERGTLTVIAAPPRCYKTSLMLFLAWQLAAAGRRVRYLAGEMTQKALMRRVVAMAAEVSPSVVGEPRVLAIAERVAAAVRGVDELGDRLVFGRAPITLGGIKASASAADVVFVDYLQLVQPDREHAGRADELDATMRALLAVTQRGGTVIAAAALNRSGRDDASLSSIRGSSAIEYGATAVYMANERGVGIDPGADGPRPARVSVVYRCVKQREGEAVPLRFDLALKLGPLPLEPSP